MSSLAMRVLGGLFRTKRLVTRSDWYGHRRLARRKRSGAPPRALLRDRVVTQHQRGGCAVYTVAPSGPTTQTVLFLHGGSYVSQISQWHWRFIAHLADAGVEVVVPVYGLAPHSTYRDAYALLNEVYADIVRHHPLSSVTIMGDSAGGGLALGFVQTLSVEQRPGRLVLVSPWLDLTLAAPGLDVAQREDPWLWRNSLRIAGTAWAGGDDPTQPRLSPLNGPLVDLPPLRVYAGGCDLTYVDVQRLDERVHASGGDIHTEIVPGALHVFPILPTPEGRAARKRIVGLFA